MKRRIILVVTMMILLVSTMNMSYAADGIVETESSSDMVKNIVLNTEALNLSEEEKEILDNDNALLARKVAMADENEISSIIAESSKDDIIINKLKEIAAEEKISSDKAVSISLDGNDLVEVYETNDKIVEVGPLYVAIEEKDTETIKDEQVSALATTSTKTASANRTYYAKPYGYKMFTVYLTCKFSYDGTKAKYHSGLDGHYKRYLGGALYSVSNWKEGKEAAGTAYQAYCRGNFSEGIAIKGTGIVWFEYYIKHNIKCSKAGKITKTYTMD